MVGLGRRHVGLRAVVRSSISLCSVARARSSVVPNASPVVSASHQPNLRRSSQPNSRVRLLQTLLTLRKREEAVRRLDYVRVTGLALLAGCLSPTPSTSIEATEGVVGTWRLVEFWDRASSTAPRVYRFGQTPCGYIIYTTTGHMSAQIASTPLARNLPADSSQDGVPIDGREAAEMLRRHVSYFGTYRVDSTRTVVIHRVVAGTSTAPAVSTKCSSEADRAACTPSRAP